jgi:hypothetical protein
MLGNKTADEATKEALDEKIQHLDEWMKNKHQEVRKDERAYISFREAYKHENNE